MPANNTRSRRWCFTLNNFSPEDVERLAGLGTHGVKYLVAGRETGESGTPHLQGFIILDEPTRFNTVKALIGSNPHLEVARGSSKQAAAYCKKEDDSPIEIGTLPNGSGTMFQQYRAWVLEQERMPTSTQIANEFPGMWMRYGKSRCLEFARDIRPLPPNPEGIQLRPHQQALVDVIEAPANNRHIHFVVDPLGNSGKSFLTNWLCREYPDRVQSLGVGRRDDMAFAVDPQYDIFLVDVPRGQLQYLQFPVLEGILDGRIMCNKYGSRMKWLDCFPAAPHVFVFTNEHPDMNALTQDRYVIHDWMENSAFYRGPNNINN